MSTRKLIEAILENKAVEADSLLKETMNDIVSEKLTEAKKIIALRFGIEDYAGLNEVAEPRGDLKDACWKNYTAVGLKKKNGRMVPNCVPKEEINEDSDSAARELHTYADDNAQLHKTSHVPVAKNLEKKFKKGTYDHEKAKTLWKYHADRAADAYAKEHGSGQKGHEMFSVADRKKAAERMANDHHAEMKAGNFHKEEIENPNSSGQGHDPDHMKHPLHDTILKHGYEYSHSTPVRRQNAEKYIHHTYKKGERVIGVSDDNKTKWQAKTSTASGREHTNHGKDTLEKYLKNLKEETESLDKGKIKDESKGFAVGDKVIPNVGPHKNHPHEVIHVHGNGDVNIRPLNMRANRIKYRLGAVKASPSQIKLHEETLDEANVQKMGRVKMIRARIRGGKVQRRKKVSAVKGFTLRGGKLTRMSPQERLKRKRGARRAKIKRRAKASRIRMKYQRALRKRKSLGLR
jgi:hypothetical protein